jgi:hypothetical protein
MRLDHSEADAILHLQEATIEVQLVDKLSATINCQICSLSKAKKIISQLYTMCEEQSYE